MEKKLTDAQIYELAEKNGYDYRVLKAIIRVESGQSGFSDKTGKIIIQFEPSWFKRSYTAWKKDVKNITWQSNGVSDQTEEWLAFNSAYAVNPDAAMKSTSIGMMQLMGFHYAALGFKTVGEMWDFCKVSEYNQVVLAIRWIKLNSKLDKAVKLKDWRTIAYYYNGELYEKYNYHIKLPQAYNSIKDFKN